jgi:hypothetical protein
MKNLQHFQTIDIEDSVWFYGETIILRDFENNILKYTNCYNHNIERFSKILLRNYYDLL